MKPVLKTLLLGFIIWVIPFLASVLVWDPATGAPRIADAWFNALMAVTFTIGLVIALKLYFKDKKKSSKKEGLGVGLLWFVQLSVLDLIVLVGLFGMAFAEYLPLVFTYLIAPLLAATVGFLKEK